MKTRATLVVATALFLAACGGQAVENTAVVNEPAIDNAFAETDNFIAPDEDQLSNLDADTGNAVDGNLISANEISPADNAF
jgi:hypothetical protein